jgi:superfamily II DNA or RNA helicase
MGVWDGKKSYFKSGRINLGLWREAMMGCREVEAPFIIENKEDFPINRDVTLEKVQNFCKEFFKDHKVKTKDGWIPFTPYDHQIDAAYKILKNRYCMAEVATSGGKSLIISIVMFYTLKKIKSDAKFLIIVPSITLVTQFYDNIVEYNLGINRIEKMKDDKTDVIPPECCDVRVEEVMSERPRKYSGTDNANVYIGTYQSLEKWPKEFFYQFHTIATDEAHGAKAKTITTILEHTFKRAYCRFGVSGTFPSEESCEILTIQSVLGPKITEVSADELKKKGIITPMDIKVVLMNHGDPHFYEQVKYIRKHGDGKAAFDFEKKYAHQSDKRLAFISNLISKCTNNTLLLFHTIDNGQRIFNRLQSDIKDKEFFYIDGEVSGRKREEIKKQMEITKKQVEYTILNFGDFEVDVKSDFQILLSNGKYKYAKEITPDDDIDDNFIEKLRK